MRSFVAIELPGHLRRRVSARIEEVAPGLPAARWVRPENYHLTLRFLGEIEKASLRELIDALRPVFEHSSPFPLQLSGGGTFPPRRPARVAWIGLVSTTEIEPLAQEVSRVCEAFAERPEDRRFSPHLTVARCRRPWPKAAVESWREAFPGPTTGDPFVVARGVLMKSRLGPGGARYERLAELSMGATT